MFPMRRELQMLRPHRNQRCVLPQIELMKTLTIGDTTYVLKPAGQLYLGLRNDDWEFFRVSPRSCLPSDLQMDLKKAMTVCGVNLSRSFHEQPPSVITKVIERVTSTSVSANGRSKRSILSTPQNGSKSTYASSL